MKTRNILIALLLVSLLATFCACGETGDTSSEPPTTSEETSEAPEDTNIYPEVIDLLGREINVLCWDWGAGSNSILGYTGEILYSTEDRATAVDTAKAAVIDWVEDTYHCTIGGILDSSADPQQTVMNMLTTGLYNYDILFQNSTRLSGMVTNNLLTDLNSIPTLHLSNSWWDQNSVQDLSIANHLYYVCGDINTYDNLGTWCILFNKDLKEAMNIEEDFYQTVKDGGWTFDHFMEICKDVTHESDGTPGINELDTWAFGTETYNMYVQVLAGGIKIVEKDDNDLPFFTVEKRTEETYNALTKIVDFYKSADVMVANDGTYNSKYTNVWEGTVHKAFIEGRELFYECGLINVASFRRMDNEFGILPVPMTFDGQDRFYHTVSSDNSSYLAIPFGVPNEEDLGVVIEAISMKSKELVTPEFYDIQLKYRDARDDESAEMLDLIFATRSFDLGSAFRWGNILGQYMTLDSNFASRFDSALIAANTAMQNTIDSIKIS
ncbi:MAG: extracellular solute-binding protein [Clostridiales bacterium]|nr:extracellular solute-binding protein [Candidatus Coliplasma caballi]